MVEEDHAHDLDEAIVLERYLRGILIPNQVLTLKQADLL